MCIRDRIVSYLCDLLNPCDLSNEQSHRRYVCLSTFNFELVERLKGNLYWNFVFQQSKDIFILLSVILYIKYLSILLKNKPSEKNWQN